MSALLQAALNGSRRREEHPAIPVSSWEVAAAAADAVRAGAGAVHVHVRDLNGVESLAAADVARAVSALRTAVPRTPAGVSTGAWIVPDPDLRERMVSQWSTRPDYASVNFHEEGAERLAELLLALGIAVEVGVATPGAAERLAASGLASGCLRVLLEPQPQVLATALDTVQQVEAVFRAAHITLPLLLHGAERTAWPMIAEAATRGCDTRIGFEDTLTLPDGSMAASNTVLVVEARRILGGEPRDA